ncbi:MAG: hypothetical protein ABIR54_07810 [Burkholderiaceae bacterium]
MNNRTLGDQKVVLVGNRARTEAELAIEATVYVSRGLAGQRPLDHDVDGFPIFAPSAGEQLSFNREKARELRLQLRQRRLLLDKVLKLL